MRDQIQGAQIFCHTANAVPEGCELSARCNDNEMKRNAEVGLSTQPSILIALTTNKTQESSYKN